MRYTRTGRMSLEEKCVEVGHWHIESYCAIRDGHGVMWKIGQGCWYDALFADSPIWYAKSINGVRERIREGIG